MPPTAAEFATSRNLHVLAIAVAVFSGDWDGPRGGHILSDDEEDGLTVAVRLDPRRDATLIQQNGGPVFVRAGVRLVPEGDVMPEVAPGGPFACAIEIGPGHGASAADAAELSRRVARLEAIIGPDHVRAKPGIDAPPETDAPATA